MQPTNQSNPYSVTSVVIVQKQSQRRIRLTTWLGLTVSGLLLAYVAFAAERIPYLYVRYPGLNDPSAKPVDYWPQLEVELSMLTIVFITPLAFTILVPTLLSLRQQRRLNAGRENRVAHTK